uniref:Protein transport protein SEC23 n=1 Tax=Quercus lobata TaxID=97700 RepID=A0A7N2LY61_QUELO
MQSTELLILPDDPLLCSQCGAVLNPYARLDYTSRVWFCPFCYKNPFPHSYSGIGETNLPAELFSTYSTVEYSFFNPKLNGMSSPSSSMSLTSMSMASSFSSTSSLSGLDSLRKVVGPAFVFVVDTCTAEEELGALTNVINSSRMFCLFSLINSSN